MTNDELINDEGKTNFQLFNWSLNIGKYFVILISSLVILASSPASATEITKIEQTRSLGVDYLNIETGGNVKGKGVLLEDELLIDFPKTSLAKNLKISSRKSKRIASISTKQIGSTARIIVALRSDSEYEIVNIFGRNKTTVEMYDRLDFTEKLFAAWENASLKKQAEELKPYKYKPSLTTKDQSLKGKIIILDPGHGGNDPGAFSTNKIPEKNLTLKTARAAAKLLRQAGATVYLTRNEDRRSGLKDIVNFANKVRADIFISIHYNSSYKSKISGTESYYYNKVSRKFARILHKNLVQTLKRRDRGLRRAMFYTVHHTKMPAVLIEPAYLSNYNESSLAQSANFHNKIAQAILKGVKSYF